MGYYLVNAVMVDPPEGITHRDMLCLVFMALSARDYPKKERGITIPAGIYTAGWSWIAMVPLRRDKYDATAERVVADVLRTLRDLGAIEPVINPLPASRQRAYVLNYEAPPRKQ